MTNKIKIIDSVMGSGKSTYIRNYMRSHPEKNFVYLTPYNEEVAVTAELCPENHFVVGRDHRKLSDLSTAISEGRSVVATHAAFEQSRHENLALAAEQNYTLIVDESMMPIEFLSIKEADISLLCDSGAISVGNDGLVEWLKEKFDSRYNDIMELAEQGKLRKFENKFAHVLPPEFFSYFDEVYVMSYMFEFQPMYFYLLKYGYQLELFQVKTIRSYVNNKDTGEYELMRHNGKYSIPYGLKERLVVYNGPLNSIGERKGSLNWSWHKNNNKTKRLCDLSSNIRSFIRTHCKINSVDDVMWTCYKGAADKWYHKVKPRDYVKGFLACNAKATNKFQDKTCLAYCINKRIEPFLKRFLVGEGEFNEDAYALQEFLQWIFRSNLRVDSSQKKVNLYLPSKHMRKLLENYLNETPVA